jgi:hypothetical protein
VLTNKTPTMKRKFIFFLIVSILLFEAMQAQPLPQIRFKTGISYTIPSRSSTGYAFKAPGGGWGSVMIGGEFSKPLKSKKGAWHVGFLFEDSDNGPVPNRKNLIPLNLNSTNSWGFGFIDGPAKTTVYAGVEKYLNRDPLRPSKNYFSVFGGVGVAFTLNSLKGWGVTTDQKYETRDGRMVEGYTTEYSRPKFPVAPLLYAGIRYNITNAKGREVLIIELRGGYELTPYYRQIISYTLDGVSQQDRLRQKGWGVQLGIVVPLHSFGKRKR